MTPSKTFDRIIRVTKDSGIEILDVVELPAQGEPITVLVPTVDQTAGLVTGVVEIGGDADNLTPSYEALLEDIDRQLPSSLLRSHDTWTVTDIREEPDTTLVSFGRQGHRELQMTLSGNPAPHLALGRPILGTEALRLPSGPFGLGTAKVEFVPDPDPPEPVPITIPVTRLHRPKREGCEATHTLTHEAGESAEINLTVLGSGANSGYTIRGAMKDSYTARSTCMETVVPAKLLLIPTKTVVNGTEVAYGLHAKLIELDGDHPDRRPIPPALDDCERSDADLANTDTKHFPFRGSPGNDTGQATIEVEKETYGRVSIGLEVGGALPVKLGLDYERSTTKAATLEVTFAAGADYLAYGPLRRPGSTLGQQLEICWATRA